MAPKVLAPDAVTSAAGSAAAAVVWRLEGQLHVTVIVKSTFAFAQDAAMTRAPPQPILRAEVHHGKHPTRSVQFTSDLVPYLPQADVLFTGHAHARAGGVVQAQLVRLEIFDGAGAQPLLNKALLVQDSKGFDRMPLVYERAFGGLGSQDNPLGTGALAGSPEPNIVNPMDPRRVASFGPIGRIWPARKRLLGKTPRSAIDAAVVELPRSFDWTYYQAAPPEQRIDYLQGDEWILLEGLHPTMSRLQMQLPGARGLAWIDGLADFGVPEGHEVILNADTLRIDGDEQRCTMVWRAAFSVPSEEALQALQIMAAVQIRGERLSWIDAGGKPSDLEITRRDEASTGTLTLDADVQKKPALPFGTTMTISSGRGPRTGTLPFLEAYHPSPSSLSSPPAQSALPPAREPDDSSATLSLSPDADEVTRERSALFVGDEVTRQRTALSLGLAGWASYPQTSSAQTPSVIVSQEKALSSSSSSDVKEDTASSEVTQETGPSEVTEETTSFEVTRDTAVTKQTPPGPSTEEPAASPQAPPAAAKVAPSPEPVATVSAARPSGPWAPQPEAAPLVTPAPPKQAGPPAPSPALRRGIYGRFDDDD
jgi:hypothetical protein